MDSVVALTDGKAGHEAQALGVAERLHAAPTLWRIAGRRGVQRLLRPTLDGLTADGLAADGLAAVGGGPPPRPPWPDLVIACGAATARPAAALRRAGAGRVVFLQRPPGDPRRFDLIAAPAHDHFAAPNAIETRGAPNRVSPTRLAEAADRWRPHFADHPRPWIAFLVGGASKRHRFPLEAARALAAAARAVVGDGSLFATLSRRTGAEAGRALRAALSDAPGWTWDGTGDNPYWGMLALADAVIVTEDSVSMLCEAATAGRPCFTAPLPGGSARFDRFHAGMRAAGYARRIDEGGGFWTPPPLDDAAFVATAIRRAFFGRAAVPIL